MSSLDLRTVDGTRLHVETFGPEAAPAVVLVHGWACSTEFWAPVVERLAEDHRVIAYDQRGHGRSEAAPSARGCSTGALADDLVTVLTATLPVGRRAVVAGHSMGGMTLMAAAKRPELRERAAALLLASTGSGDLAAEARVLPVPGRAGRRLAHRALLTAALPLGPVNAAGLALVKYAVMGPGAARAEVEQCARIVHGTARIPRSHWGRVLADLELGHLVPQLDLPTSVLYGTRDRMTPPPHAQRLHAALPRPERLIELPGIGHMSPVENPDAVAAEIRRLAAEHLAATGRPPAALRKQARPDSGRAAR